MCNICRMHKPLCVCNISKKFNIKTKVSVIIPRFEWFKSSNTGSLVKVALDNSEVFIKGLRETPLNVDNLILEDYNNFILYPGGVPLTREFVDSLDKPINLIVPDGTWKSAPRVLKKEEKLHRLKRVTLVENKISQYKVRRTKVEGRISTFEAIIYALDQIENNQEMTKELMNLFLIKVDRLLWLRGKIVSANVKGGVPNIAKMWQVTGDINFKE